MTIDRIKEIQEETAYPNSISVQQALLKVWNECQQEQEGVKKCTIHDVVGSDLHPQKINHGDVWGHGKDWVTFYCPNENCKR